MLISMLHKIKYRGVAMVEYAVLLAFVCVVAAVFIDDGGIGKGIEGSINKVLAIFDLNTNKKYTNYALNSQHGWSFEDGKFIPSRPSAWTNRTNCTNDIPLGDTGTYQFTIDYSAMKDYLALKGTEVSEDDMKNYVSNLNLGIWGVKEDGSLATNEFQYNHKVGDGYITEDTSKNRAGDSGELKLSEYVNGTTKYYQLKITEADGNAKVRYSVIHQNAAQAIAQQNYDDALINAGITITKK